MLAARLRYLMPMTPYLTSASFSNLRRLAPTTNSVREYHQQEGVLSLVIPHPRAELTCRRRYRSAARGRGGGGRGRGEGVRPTDKSTVGVNEVTQNACVQGQRQLRTHQYRLQRVRVSAALQRVHGTLAVQQLHMTSFRVRITHSLTCMSPQHHLHSAQQQSLHGRI